MKRSKTAEKGTAPTKNNGLLVRSSRDGDRFHYTWTARRCLLMLPEDSDLVAVSVEGPSAETGEAIPDEEVIDVGEYYGGETIETCTRIDYIQLKHSTVRTERVWQLSELRSTLSRFGSIFHREVKKSGLAAASSKLRFKIVSNRRFGPSLVSYDDGRTRLTEEALASVSLPSRSKAVFERILSLEGTEAGYLGQGLSLERDLSGYLAADDEDAPLRLRGMVADKALSHTAKDNVIRRRDLLGALRTRLEDLLPSPNLIDGSRSYPRAQEGEFALAITNSTNPVVIHAAGGVGKSTLVTRLPELLPNGSVSVIFDCFANGAYREPGRSRHTVHRSLPQIANELAAQRLCDLLVPSERASSESYFRAFEHRLRQCSRALTERSENAVVCIIVDAVDNSVIAAEEAGEGASALKRLFRLRLPHNVRLVATSRTERLRRLDLPSTVQPLLLDNFNEEESRTNLRECYPEASELEVLEFHRLTSSNPRVQATVLAEGLSLQQMLSSLAGAPRSVDETIGASLQRTLGKVFDGVALDEREHIQRLLEAIATLRPFIPIDVLAAVAEVDRSLIESFAADFGRPLLVLNDALQFRDEPTETWFQRNYELEASRLPEFTEIIERHANDHAYAAVALPPLLLASGQTDRLLSLALEGAALPRNPAERRSIEVQRLLFALKAALRGEKYVEASKLVFKAAQEVSGAGRQVTLLASNLDLVAHLRSPHRTRELIGTQSFNADWLGTTHVCQAALYARLPGSEGEASSQLRMAEEWLSHWAENESQDSRVEVPEVLRAELAEVHWRISGPDACIRAIARWRNPVTRFRMTATIARRSIDAGRKGDLTELLDASREYVEIQSAIISELHRDGQKLEQRHLTNLVGLLRANPFRAPDGAMETTKTEIDSAVVAVVEAAIRAGIPDRPALSAILEPLLRGVKFYDFSFHYRHRRGLLIRLFVLCGVLRGEEPTLKGLTGALTAHEGKQRQPSESRDESEFTQAVSTLLPWHSLCVQLLFDPLQAVSMPAAISKLTQRFADASHGYWGRELHLSDDVAVMWLWLLRAASITDTQTIDSLSQWTKSDGGISFIPTWITMARVASASPALTQLAYEFANKGAVLMEESPQDATQRAESYVMLSRALLRIDRHEAAHYFDQAIETVSKLGDEVISRWRAVLDVAEAAAGVAERGAELAYRVSRCAEFVYEYQDKHFDWESTISAMVGLSPVSAVCTASRWNDRRFGWSETIVETLLMDLCSRNIVKPIWCNPFLRLQSFRQCDVLLGKMLDGLKPHERNLAFERALNVLELERHGVYFWKQLETLAERYHLATERIAQRIVLEEDYERHVRDRGYGYESSHRLDADVPLADALWMNERLAEKLYTPAGLLEALAIWRRGRKEGSILSDFLFIERVFRDARPERAVEVIGSLAAVTSQMSLWYSHFFDSIPSSWRSRHSVNEAIRTAALSVARVNCLTTSRSRYGQGNLFDTLSQVSGIPRDRIAREALQAAADVSVIDDAEALFELVGQLSFNLDAQGAAEVLDFALEMIEAEAPEHTGDGPWRVDLVPGINLDRALCGFMYAQLGSPIAADRWNAAHAVVELGLAADGPRELDELLELDGTEGYKPYVDASLPFYELHAKLWLLIALARIAKEHPEKLTHHVDWFAAIAFGESHVLLREFAKDALVELARVSGSDQNFADRLHAVNQSPLPLVESAASRQGLHTAIEAEQDDDRSFILGYDVDKHWLAPLDKVFSHRSGTAERVCRRLIKKHWAGRYTGSHKEDPRSTRERFFRNRETSYYRGRYPKTDDLNSYLCFHALMFTAGELLGTTPVRRSDGDKQDKFRMWLSEQLLTRPDGKWLWESRDPEPFDLTLSGHELNDSEWKTAVQHADFANCLVPDARRLTLHGRWSVVRGHRVERFEVHSVLVPKHTAKALVRSLEKADPFDSELFERDYDSDMVYPDFRVQHWIEQASHSPKLDKFDQLAGNVSWEAFAPGDIAANAFQGVLTQNERSWTLEEAGEAVEVLRGENWGTLPNRDDSETPQPHGVRVTVTSAFLCEMLRRSSLSLIVRINIERESHSWRQQNDGDDSHAHIPPQVLYCLLEDPGESKEG